MIPNLDYLRKKNTEVLLIAELNHHSIINQNKITIWAIIFKEIYETCLFFITVNSCLMKYNKWKIIIINWIYLTLWGSKSSGIEL